MRKNIIPFIADKLAAISALILIACGMIVVISVTVLLSVYAYQSLLGVLP